MIHKRLATEIIALVIVLNSPALSANYQIDNPADKINTPVGNMYNPATNIKNPAANIYNPAAHMDNPNPLSPVTQPDPEPIVKNKESAIIPAEQIKVLPLTQAKPVIPHKRYHYKTVREYLVAAKTAFNLDNYRVFLSITEDALRRIEAGTLSVSNKTKQKLIKYKTFGYGLLENSTE